MKNRDGISSTTLKWAFWSLKLSLGCSRMVVAIIHSTIILLVPYLLGSKLYVKRVIQARGAVFSVSIAELGSGIAAELWNSMNESVFSVMGALGIEQCV
jgi:hypothetical protein